MQLSENTALLSWLARSDDHTPAAALTYDLELFRDNVPVTIPKRNPEPGNVSAVNEWLLTGLQTGNYKWTLATVDAAYIGSPIAQGEFTMGYVSTGETVKNLLHDYSIGQNYPNPCNPVTTIGYSIPEEGTVTLKVYNITGEEVATLVDENKKTGNYKVTFDVTNLSSGVYFYRFQAPAFSQTKKMIITKD